MTHLYRDDAPEEFSLTRRKLLVGSALVAGGVSLSPLDWAQSTGSAVQAGESKFMELSSLLINHHLDAEVGARMATAMMRINPTLIQDVDAILSIAKLRNARIVEDFYADVPAGHLKDTAYAIISAWYSGVIENSSNAEVFAFETALMYQPTRDVMTIPTYAISGPSGWTSEAPPMSDMPTF